MEISQKIDAAQRRQMIAEAAYFRAERRGFDGGDPVRDWVEAEAEVDAEIARLEHEQALERLEARIETATKKLAALKRRLTSAAAGAKAEWQADAERLAGLRDKLRAKVAEIRSESAQVREKARRQAEKLWEEISQVIERATGERDARR